MPPEPRLRFLPLWMVSVRPMIGAGNSASLPAVVADLHVVASGAELSIGPLQGTLSPWASVGFSANAVTPVAPRYAYGVDLRLTSAVARWHPPGVAGVLQAGFTPNGLRLSGGVQVTLTPGLAVGAYLAHDVRGGGQVDTSFSLGAQLGFFE